MNTLDYNDWIKVNQSYLEEAINVVRLHLERSLHTDSESAVENSGATVAPPAPSEQADLEINPPPALQTLCKAFSLSRFERDLLLLCAGVELDSEFARLVAKAQGKGDITGPTFSLALSILPDSHWSALTPGAPLRRWRMIELGSGNILSNNPLTIDERVLHYLTGISQLDVRLEGLVWPAPAYPPLPTSHGLLAKRVVDYWSGATAEQQQPVIQFCGRSREDIRPIVLHASYQSGKELLAMNARDIPSTAAERDALARLWEREAVLGNTVLLLEYQDAEHLANVISFASNIGAPLVLSGREPLPLLNRRVRRLDVPPANTGERLTLWRAAMGPRAEQLNGQMQRLVSQFNLSAEAIYEVALQAQEAVQTKSDDEFGAVLWQACRYQARKRLDELAQRIEPIATWESLVLPENQINILRQISTHVRQRARVYDEWGFRGMSSRGLGISALFAGVSGTGKTMASEVLANELSLDLYRIDLSQVVSKYIGETEKNLRRVFDAAEQSGAILLFDEADALFGKRTEVKDSHDRYANIETSYLLQRMEQYSGLAILTTNLKKALDQAFMRRIRFVVQFPFPGAIERAEIWRRIFPADTPTEGLEPNKLARLDVTGGNIRNVALNAAFLAADENEPVRMRHVLQAASSEYAKLEKSLSDNETKGWL